MSQNSPQNEPLRPPHPLALELIERLGERHHAPILEIGRGSGRNRSALEAAGYNVIDVDEPATTPAAAAISTHALLHGSPQEIAATLSRIVQRLERGAVFFATFGSQRDARYGEGTRLGPLTFAPESGDEAGVPHTYFDETELRRLLERDWIVESLEERNVDRIAGSWAHQKRPLKDSIHWFARLMKR